MYHERLRGRFIYRESLRLQPRHQLLGIGDRMPEHRGRHTLRPLQAFGPRLGCPVAKRQRQRLTLGHLHHYVVEAGVPLGQGLVLLP